MEDAVRGEMDMPSEVEDTDEQLRYPSPLVNRIGLSPATLGF